MSDISTLDLGAGGTGHALCLGASLLLDDDDYSVTCIPVEESVSFGTSACVLPQGRGGGCWRTDGGMSLLADNHGALDNGGARVVDAVKHRLDGPVVSMANEIIDE